LAIFQFDIITILVYFISVISAMLPLFVWKFYLATFPSPKKMPSLYIREKEVSRKIETRGELDDQFYINLRFKIKPNLILNEETYLFSDDIDLNKVN
jgi:hypothetical protein